jgi:hypothetical protein
MASIYRVHDLASGKELALKQLETSPDDTSRDEAATAFEREFHVLAQLSHPHVVQVYDYGVGTRGPFYTMELLDGGDVRERAPLPWQEACALAHDVCSALALLHSRRLVHRDVSPRNIRCTKSGQAKLIDFGATVPMGPAAVIVGTPQVVAPEVMQRANLDARTDLFSLGATLYFALTRKLPYSVRRFEELADAWTIKPKAPSRHVSEIPEALDTLVLSLLSIDPGMRPRTAFEVMQRLATISGAQQAEPSSVSRAYLSAPSLAGRDQVMADLQREMALAFRGQVRSVLIQGAPGLGRSRMLDACGLAAKTLGALVLRVSGRAGTAAPFRVARALLAQSIEVAHPYLPDVRTPAVSETESPDEFPISLERKAPPESQDVGTLTTPHSQVFMDLVRRLLRASRRRPVLLAVDDIDGADPSSAAVLAALLTHAGKAPLCIVATAEDHTSRDDNPGFDVLVRQSTLLCLSPLSHADTEDLFESIFGDVPNVGVLSDGIYAIARGNPRASMDLAQHLVDQGLVVYERGAWTLPTSLDRAALPKTAEDAVVRRIAALTPVARWLAETQALASHRAFTRRDYVKLRPDLNGAEIGSALMTLVKEQVLVGDGRVHVLSHRGFSEALISSLNDAERAERHRALFSLYEGRTTLAAVRHAFLGGLESNAFSELAPTLQGLPEAVDLDAVADLGASEIAATFERALTAAERGGRSPRELNELRRWLASFSVRSDDAYYFRVAKPWCERLRLDSGYEDWLALTDIVDERARLSKAMQLAFERYHACPEAERVYRPDEAIKGLAHFVGISLAVASSRIEMSTTESLAALLEPFAPTSDLIFAIWQNAIAAREVSCRAQPERARARWLAIYARLQDVPQEQRPFADVFRRAIAYGLGSAEASMGMASAEQWAEALDADPVQRINALYLRRIVRLEQGDWDGAELFRKRAELARIGARGRQMFTNLTWVELVACAMAADLSGLSQCRDRIAALSRRAPGWIPHAHLADGFIKLVCDDFGAAADAFERAIERTAPSVDASYPLHSAWCPATAAHVEALIGLEKYEQARAAGERALAMCRNLEVGVASFCIARALALAEGKLGRFAEAAARLDAVIQSQLELKVTGLHLGATYEARARIAIWEHDASAAEQYSRLTAREYRHSEGSPLGARYERLMNEAVRVGCDMASLLLDLRAVDPRDQNIEAPADEHHTGLSELDLTTETLHEGS